MERIPPPGREFYTLGPQPPNGTWPGVMRYGALSFGYYSFPQLEQRKRDFEYASPYLAAYGYETGYWDYLLRPDNGVHVNAVYFDPGDEIRWATDACPHPQLLATEAERKRREFVVMESGGAFDVPANRWYRWMALFAHSPQEAAAESLMLIFQETTAHIPWYVTMQIQHDRKDGPPLQQRRYEGWLLPRF